MYVKCCFFFWLLTACNEVKDTAPLSYKQYYETDFFKEVQLAGIYEDSKTFVDCVPKKSLHKIIQAYEAAKGEADFSLKVFVEANFKLPQEKYLDFETDTTKSMEGHIETLWSVLKRDKDSVISNSSLIPLPGEYIVPGGRFREIYYWDSYFTMLGLIADGKRAVAESMLDNFSFMIDSIGFIPNGNRAYYLGRSQPPFFAFMVDLLAGDDRSKYVKYLPALLKEYNFWMDNETDKVNTSMQKTANRRTVSLNDTTILNRYYDNFSGPRPESFKEDYLLVKNNKLPTEETYIHLRAGAESGWDYSSRWFADKKNLSTIHTTDIIPVDLNSLLYFEELKIAQAYNWNGDLEKADEFLNKAEVRKAAINSLLWNEKAGTYMDYDFVNGTHTGVKSMAMAYPLFVGLAQKDKARKVLQVMTDDLLFSGGLVATNINSGEQWDYPNAWAPHQWIGMKAYFNYEEYDAGYDLMDRWLKINRKVYRKTGKMMEKYNAVDTALVGGGGEYPLQDGFGWTNGVSSAMLEILTKREQLNTKEVN